MRPTRLLAIIGRALDWASRYWATVSLNTLSARAGDRYHSSLVRMVYRGWGVGGGSRWVGEIRSEREAGGKSWQGLSNKDHSLKFAECYH